jgi:hypothetical protein
MKSAANKQRVGWATDWSANQGDEGQTADLEAFQRGLTVRLIATGRDALKICVPDEDIAQAVARNEEGYDHFPVADGNRIVGLVELVPFTVGAKPDGKVRERMTGLSDENLIGADASILSFVRDADRQSCRLVVSGRKISGLVSLSDLQRLPVRVALFGLVTSLEMIMANAVRRECPVAADWIDRLSDKRKSKVRKEMAKAKSADTYIDMDLLRFTQFADKATILKKSTLFQWSKTSFMRDFRRIQSLRDDLAHANDYADTRETAAAACETVRMMDRWIERLSNWPSVADPASLGGKA